jgi:hypothetical protein
MASTYRTPGSGPKDPGAPKGRAIAMTPAEHYVMAERLLEELLNGDDDFADSADVLAEIANVLAVAQVHATLAAAYIPRQFWPSRGETEAWEQSGGEVVAEVP